MGTTLDLPGESEKELAGESKLPIPPILLVEDDPDIQLSTRRILEREGYSVVVCEHGAQALECLRSDSYSLILTDIRMPMMDGLELVRAAHLIVPEIPFIVMSAYGTVDQAVWVMKFGGVDFLSKPFKRSALLDAVRRAVERRGVVVQEEGFFFGSQDAMVTLREQVRKVARASASVLVVGESGVGKEGISKLLHQWSPRSNRPWVAINCAALPENLIESELFGHEKGAFTGAGGARVGLFELAHTGTLLLDEIGELPLEAQAKLLRVLQEGEVRRIGSSQSRKVDVRVIASTHRDLQTRVAQGLFREDLLFRLEVIRLEIPPLRERKKDLRALAGILLSRFSRSRLRVSEDALRCMTAYSWPGNVRELANVLERASVFALGEEILPSDLPLVVQESEGAHSSQLSEDKAGTVIEVKMGTPLREVEDLLIHKTLEWTDGDKSMTAKLLGINSRTIYRKLSGVPQS